jgi:hypothetical protein
MIPHFVLQHGREWHRDYPTEYHILDVHQLGSQQENARFFMEADSLQTSSLYYHLANSSFATWVEHTQYKLFLLRDI